MKTITTRDIEDMHPINVLSESDVYFAQLARKILNELRRNKLIVDNFSEWLRDISLKSVAYFEDVISGLGLFAGLRKMHGQMFGKKLPFLTFGSDYLDDEINIEDLQFLIWTIIQESVNESDDMQFLNVENPGIRLIASMIINILEEEYETAPENEKLHYWLHEYSYDDFFKFRTLLSWLHYDSYLSMNYPNKAIESSLQELKKRPGNNLPISKEQFLYFLKSNRIFFAVCTPLAVKATDWWKAITVNEEIINILNATEYRPHSFYRIKESNDTVIKISPILNDMETLDMDCNSFEGKNDGKDKETIHTALVKFKDLWQVNGFMLFADGADDKIKTEKTEKEKDEKKKDGILFTYEKIMKHTKNKPLVFFKTFNEWFDFWTTVFPDLPNKDDLYKTSPLKNEENLGMFIHKTAGTFTIPCIARVIKTPNNKLYDKKMADKHGITLLCGLYSVPLELLEYIIKNNLLPDVKLNSLKGEAHGKWLVQDNMRFIIRFFQPELFNGNI
ncbi:MAG: DUF3843 family protein [Candidatus Symbiothrix sp.]|jgi:hypothetical protein|nr:DUF3843 family protein [Candidatus Symbiothrix sp.]